MRKNNGRKGFTLIELMIVIAIIIILAAIAIPNYLRMTERAKKAALESDLKSLATALETFHTDWGQYPATGWDNMKAELTGKAAAGGINVAGEYNLLGEEGPIVYITEAAVEAVETKADISKDYATNADTGFVITVHATIGGVDTTFTCTGGGTIEISP